MESDSTRPDLVGASGAIHDAAVLDAECPALSRIGRFVILDEIGRGGMGVVLAAYDPELHRKLAIKLLRKGGRQDATQRLLREAQALAKLTHPNVVAVHDVGVHDNNVFIVMEQVVGVTLRTWLAAGPRPWRETLARLVEAGRGLAAAHAAGLVHRDVKPDNIMLGEDGRVRVMDFGLAREAPPDREPVEWSLGGALELSLTSPGAVLGTPAYMAPEQFIGETSDTRTDIFGFCVVLYESLYGARPFTGTNLGELRHQVLTGERAPVPAHTPVPGWVRAVIERGLKRAPEERWQTMEELLTAITDDPRVRRRRWLIVGGAMAIGLAVLVGSWGRETLRVQRCATEGALVLADWDDATRLRLRDGLRAMGIEQAPDIAARVERGLDEWTAGWQATRTAACLHPDDLADARSICQERLHGSLRSVLDVLLHPRDRLSVFRATSLVASLPSPTACDGAGALVGPATLPAGPLRERVELERGRLAHTRVLDEGLAGDGGALALAEQVLAVSDELGEPSLRVEALQTTGALELKQTRYKSAESHLRAAYFLALAHGLDLQAAAAADTLITIQAAQVRYDAALEWGDHAAALLQRSGQQHSVVELNRLSALWNVLMRRGDYDTAADHARRGLALAEALHGPEHPMVADMLYQLAVLATRTEDNARGVELATRALGIYEGTLGPDMPRSIPIRLILAGALDNLDRRVEAIEVIQRALTLGERVYGPEHPDLGACLDILGYILMVDDDEAALDVFRRGLALKQRALGPEHPKLVVNYIGIGGILNRLGRPAEALEPLERGLVLVGDATAEHNEPIDLRLRLADALWATGQDRPRARALAEEAHRLALALKSGDPQGDRDEAARWLAEHPLPRNPASRGAER